MSIVVPNKVRVMSIVVPNKVRGDEHSRAK